jgi:hypothetical protein
MKRFFMIAVWAASIFSGVLQAEMPDYSVDRYGKVWNFVLYDGSKDVTRRDFQDISDVVCNGRDVCIVGFWDDIRLLPRSFPMSNAAVSAKRAQYNLNQNTGLDRLSICSKGGC